jgi:hydroxymethylbilane synthase
MAQLRSMRPDLKIEPLRGNLDTRLRKLDEGGYDAIVLAAAGLKRLGLGERIREVFEPTVMLPAAGQGALGIEIRTDRQDVVDALATLAHFETWLAVSAERAVSRTMGGSCSMPLAAYATLSGDTLTLDAAWGDPEGVLALVCVQQSAEVLDLSSATALGERVAAELQKNVLAQGGSFAPPSAAATPV